MKGLGTIVVAMAAAAAALLAVSGALAQPCVTDADCWAASSTCIGNARCHRPGTCIEGWCSYVGEYSCVCVKGDCNAQCAHDPDCRLPTLAPPCTGPLACACERDLEWQPYKDTDGDTERERPDGHDGACGGQDYQNDVNDQNVNGQDGTDRYLGQWAVSANGNVTMHIEEWCIDANHFAVRVVRDGQPDRFWGT
jgi:hypothetical protein